MGHHIGSGIPPAQDENPDVRLVTWVAFPSLAEVTKVPRPGVPDRSVTDVDVSSHQRSRTMSLLRATSRRDFLLSTTAATFAASLPTIVPARVLGREGATAPGEKITLGVI